MTKPIIDSNLNLYQFDFYQTSFYENNILTEDFIKKYYYELSKYKIYKYQMLSESFIEESLMFFMDWSTVSHYQKLSNAFIAKYLNKLNLFYLKQNKHVDQLFIEKLELLK